MKKLLIAWFALSILTAWTCAPKMPSNPQGLPHTVTVRAMSGYGVTEKLDDPRAFGPQFDVTLTYIYECGFAGIYRAESGACYSTTGRLVEGQSCLDNGGRYEGKGVDSRGLCHEDWAPMVVR